MSSGIHRYSVAARLRVIAAVSVLCVLSVGFTLLWSSYKEQKTDREKAVQQAVDVAHSVIRWAHTQQTQGKLSTEQAQQTALKVIDTLRYGSNEYFWVNDMTPRVVHHPIKPELDGKDVSGMKDPNGTAIFQEFLTVVKRSGAGFVAYQWPKPGNKEPVDKISYVRGFEPWGWVVGSGLYIDDLQAAFRARAVGAGVAVVLAALLIVVMGEYTARHLGRGVNEAVRLARAIAEGDIAQGQQIHHLSKGEDEIAQLLQAMQAMSMGLGKTVVEVRQSVDSVALASQEIAAGNADLSQRTEQAASSLQSTASSMQQLSSAIQHNSASSGDVQKMAEEATRQAQHGGTVVAQVVGTMSAIHTSSRKITDIIAVIDGIAFQTNILALNAAVEAARAGEQGRGFAVVAAEVRTLALRSAQAAREIKTLIQASTDHVDAGAQLVQEAGENMAAIVGSVERVTLLIKDITQATQEQHQGVGSIHGNMVQLDEMTQQNAALVEQSAAAAGSLHQQACHLADVVSRFKLAAAS